MAQIQGIQWQMITAKSISIPGRGARHPVAAPAKVRNQIIKRQHVTCAGGHEDEQKEDKAWEDVAGDVVQRVKQQMPICHGDENRAECDIRYAARKTEAHQRAREKFEHWDRGSNHPK